MRSEHSVFWQNLHDSIYLLEQDQAEAARLWAWLQEVLPALQADLADFCQIDSVAGLGGNSVVFRVMDKWQARAYALKIPRSFEHARRLGPLPAALLALNHDHCLAILRQGESQSREHSFGWQIMPFVEGAMDLGKRLRQKLDHHAGREPGPLTRWLAEKLHETVSALWALHQKQLVFFDLKPANILIDQHDKALLADFALARPLQGQTAVAVGFTPFYAHPALARLAHQSEIMLSPAGFRFSFDIFALGKTILELLSLIDSRFPDLVVYDYNFLYLHLAACRMLDGHNLSQAESDRLRAHQSQQGKPLSTYRETWLEIEKEDFADIRYQSSQHILDDLAKLLQRSEMLEKIPELRGQQPSNILVMSGEPAPFSQRVKKIINHPVFSRLRQVPQLELLDSIYPTANHNRFEHSLGVFANARLYIRALYHDPYNPVFCQLVSEADLKAVLLAALLHDLGQYPFGHTLEEFIPEYRHERASVRFLRNPTTDQEGQTLREIIEDPERGWGVPLEQVANLLDIDQKGAGESSLFDRPDIKSRLLASIVDGPIDVDKLDYLLRDSKKCHLPYGEGIDVRRLVNNLTVITRKDDNGRIDFTIGTYEKGHIAAEALTFARYLLYQVVYWHHSSRALRVMLKEAVTPILENYRRQKSGNISRDFDQLLGVNDFPQPVGIRDVLDFIEKRSSPAGQEIVRMIKNRNYYKRILTLHPSDDNQQLSVEIFRQAIKSPDFQSSLQNQIKVRFQSYLFSLSGPGVSILAPEKIDHTLAILARPGMILCDCPEPSLGTKDQLRFIPEPQSVQKNYYSRNRAGERVSDVWNQVHSQLMSIAARGRVYCHPEIREQLMAALGPEGIRAAIISTLRA